MPSSIALPKLTELETLVTPRLSVTLVHHDGLAALRDCLRSLYLHPPSISFEVVLVDNVSTDGAVEMVTAEFPEVRLLRNERRQGFGANQNRAMEASQGEYVFLLNDDTIVHPGAFDALCATLDTHPEVGCVGPRLLNLDGSLQISCYRFPSPGQCIAENLLLSAVLPDHPAFGDYRAWPHDSEREVDFVVGAAMLVRRKVMEEVGTFDSDFFMYFEEIDWQRRMRQRGWRIAFCPNAVITHLGGQSTEGLRNRQFVEFNRGKAKYLRKHYGAAGVLAQRLSILPGALLRLFLWGGVFLLSSRRRATARANLTTWARHLRWWSGFGPYKGLKENADSN